MWYICDDGKSGFVFFVYYYGYSVIDIWVGKCDVFVVFWIEDILVLLFFIIKGVVLILMYILVDCGVLEYDQLVCYYWLEFGVNGKGGISIWYLLIY